MTDLIHLTTTRGTSLLIRTDVIVTVEGFDFAPDDKHAPGHTGAMIRLALGQFGDTVYCRETSLEVLRKLLK